LASPSRVAGYLPSVSITVHPPARRFFFLLLTGTAILLALVVRPLAMALFLATVLAVVLGPLYRKLNAALGKRPNLASAVLVLGMVVLLVAPVVAFSTFIVMEASEGLKFVAAQVRSEGVTGLVKKLPAPIQKLATDIVSYLPEPGESEAMDPKAVDQVSAVGGKTVAAVGVAAKATGSLIFQGAMMLIALFFLLVHAEDLTAWLDGVLPLPRGQTRELLTEFKSVSHAVVVSTIVTAGVQTLAALVGYLIAHVPHPLFFAGITFFVACIPAVGATAVCMVAALILFTTGHPYMALFLAIWGIAVVSLVDNLVKPLLIKSGMKMSGAIVFFALIGGLAAFGTAGLLIGPLAVALFLALLRIYQRDYRRRDSEPASRSPGATTATGSRARAAPR
jgi:predicted PurR-regulated permease PerM